MSNVQDDRLKEKSGRETEHVEHDVAGEETKNVSQMDKNVDLANEFLATHGGSRPITDEENRRVLRKVSGSSGGPMHQTHCGGFAECGDFGRSTCDFYLSCGRFILSSSSTVRHLPTHLCLISQVVRISMDRSMRGSGASSTSPCSFSNLVSLLREIKLNRDSFQLCPGQGSCPQMG